MTDPSKHEPRTSAPGEKVPHDPGPAQDTGAVPPDAAIAETPEVSHAPRLWPRVAGALLLVAGAGGAWIWQHPGSVQRTFSAVFPGLSAQDASAERIKVLETRLARLEQRPNPAPPDLGPLTARIDAMEKRTPPVPDLEPLITRIGALEARANAPRADGSPVFAAPDLGPLLARLETLERHVTNSAADPAKVDAISTRIEELSNRDTTAGLRARLEELERQLSAQTAQGAGVAEMSERAARLAQVEAASIALAAGRPLGPIPNAPPALTRFATAAPPTEAALRLAFPAASREALKVSLPDTEGKTFMERALARLQDFRLITVREGDKVLVGNAAVAILARAHTKLDAGDLNGAAQTVALLSGPPAGKMAAWLADAKALTAAREALATLAGNG